MDVVNPCDPLTWQELSGHPSFRGGFDPAWYDGDPVADLRMLREVAIMLVTAVPAYSCELIALDDATIFVRLSQGSSQVADICPSTTVARTNSDSSRPQKFWGSCAARGEQK
jgi:hypothetical protein